MYAVEDYVRSNFSLIITALFFLISFFSFLGAMLWLSLLGNNYIKHAEELPQNDR